MTKKVLWSIFAVTIIDDICTAVGIRMGFIEEANPILSDAMTNYTALSGLTIIVFVGIILYGIYKVRAKIRWLPIALSFVLFIKIYVIWMHIHWISQVI